MDTYLILRQKIENETCATNLRRLETSVDRHYRNCTIDDRELADLDVRIMLKIAELDSSNIDNKCS